MATRSFASGSSWPPATLLRRLVLSDLTSHAPRIALPGAWRGRGQHTRAVSHHGRGCAARYGRTAVTETPRTDRRPGTRTPRSPETPRRGRGFGPRNRYWISEAPRAPSASRPRARSPPRGGPRVPAAGARRRRHRLLVHQLPARRRGRKRPRARAQRGTHRRLRRTHRARHLRT